MDKKRLQELGGVVAEATEQEKILEEGMFGREGYGGEKSGEGQVVAELAQMLRDIKVFMRDGNMEDAAMMVDRAYSRAAGTKRGE